MIVTGAEISIGGSMGGFMTLFDRKYISKDSPNWRGFINTLHTNCFATLNYEGETVVIVVGYDESHYCKRTDSQDTHFDLIAREISHLYKSSNETSIKFDYGIRYLNGKEILKSKLTEFGLSI
jgi:hypothetical protein